MGIDMNQIRQQVIGMMQAGSNNPQAYIQQLLKNNPDFARMLGSQNPQQLLSQILQSQQVNPQQFMNGFNARR